MNTSKPEHTKVAVIVLVSPAAIRKAPHGLEMGKVAR